MEFFETYYTELAVTVGTVLVYLIARSLVKRVITKRAQLHSLPESRILYTAKFFNILMGAAAAAILAIIWNITIEGISLYFASIFTLLGVALFAQWSILSNITASLILFFHYSYKMGSPIKILDGDNSISGKIIDITLFYMRIQLDDGDIVSCPNNLVLQKAVVSKPDQD